MRAHGNLADPSYEPSDEELAGLMKEAFAGVKEAHEESLRAMRAEIAVLQAEARARLQGRRRQASE